MRAETSLGILEKTNMKRVMIYLPKQKKMLVFKIKGMEAVCDALEVQAFFAVVGVIHIDGCFYFPKDGEKFLEAIYDYYFLKLIGISYP